VRKSYKREFYLSYKSGFPLMNAQFLHPKVQPFGPLFLTPCVISTGIWSQFFF